MIRGPGAGKDVPAGDRAVASRHPTTAIACGRGRTGTARRWSPAPEPQKQSHVVCTKE